MRGVLLFAPALALAAAVAAAAPAAGPTTTLAAPATPGRAVFTDRRDPPYWRELDAAERERAELGQAVFNTTWVVAGLPRAQRRDGLGPLYDGASCDGCHNNGARGRGDARAGRPPGSFVMQLGGPPTAYGDVLNAQAIEGQRREASVFVDTRAVSGRYPDGARWALQRPVYVLRELGYGPLPPATVLRPRIGPALFGAGLLEAVPVAALEALRRAQPPAQRGRLAWQRLDDGQVALGRFGWQATAVSVADQTQRAFAREMGLTTRDRPHDDCTPVQVECRAAPQGGSPEVEDDLLDALLVFQRALAVPARTAVADLAADGAQLFERSGCAVCHAPRLPVQSGPQAPQIDAYTDLLVHDLGAGLADRRVDGRAVRSQWRTAPLWGLGFALDGREVALLHDGRAHSLEQAVLWHDGQARDARRRFMALPRASRGRLLAWLATL